MQKNLRIGGERDMETIQMIMMIVTPILSVLGAMLASSGFWTFATRKDAKRTAERKIIEGMAHDAIMARCKEYTERGYIYEDELSDLRKYYYEPYRELGGNGTAERAFKQVEELPIHYR